MSHWPSYPIAKNVDIISSQPSVTVISDSGRRQSRITGGHLWKIEITYDLLQKQEMSQLYSYVMSRRGKHYSFKYVPPNLRIPRGSNLGSPKVVVATSGSESSWVAGWESDSDSLLKSGDVFRYSDYDKVYMCTEDCTTEYSDNIDLISQSVANGYMVANAITNERGVEEGIYFRLYDDPTSLEHQIAAIAEEGTATYSNLTMPPNCIIRQSVYIKAKDHTGIQIACNTYTTAYDVTGGSVVRFNTTDLTATLVHGGASKSDGCIPLRGSIVHVYNGWYKCTAEFFINDVDTLYVGNHMTVLDSGGNSVFQAVDDTGIYVSTYKNRYTPNILSYPNSFANAVWVKDQLVATDTGAVSAPDTTLTAATLTEDTSTAAHRVYQSGASLIGEATAFIFVKAGTCTKCRIVLHDGVADRAEAKIDLTLGTIQSSTVGAVTITGVGSSWYMLKAVGTLTTTSAYLYLSMLDDSYTVSYTGTSRDMYSWGAMITDYNYKGVPHPYQVTSDTQTFPNLLKYSEQFDVTANWSTVGIGVVVANQDNSPSGNLTADSIVDDANGVLEYAYQDVADLCSLGTYIFSCYLKYANGHGFAALQLHFTGGTNYAAQVNIDLQTGQILTGGSLGAYSFGAIDCGNGWYRVWIAGTDIDGTSIRCSIYPAWSDTFTTSSNALGISTCYAWGAMLEQLGSANMTFEPPLIETIPNETDLITENVDFNVSMDSDIEEYRTKNPELSTYKAKFIEAL